MDTPAPTPKPAKPVITEAVMKDRYEDIIDHLIIKGLIKQQLKDGKEVLTVVNKPVKVTTELTALVQNAVLKIYPNIPTGVITQRLFPFVDTITNSVPRENKAAMALVKLTEIELFGHTDDSANMIRQFFS